MSKQIENSHAPGLSLNDSEIDLVLLSPIAEGLQQNLNLLHTFWQTWVLIIKSQKRKNTNFSEKIQRSGKEIHHWFIHTHN